MFNHCETCDVLREQLAYEREQNKIMLETLTSLLKPQVITAPEISGSAPKPITPKFMTWSRRRAELERMDKERTKLSVNSELVAKPDSSVNDNSVEKLEEELGIKGA